MGLTEPGLSFRWPTRASEYPSLTYRTYSSGSVGQPTFRAGSEVPALGWRAPGRWSSSMAAPLRLQVVKVPAQRSQYACPVPHELRTRGIVATTEAKPNEGALKQRRVAISKPTQRPHGR